MKTAKEERVSGYSSSIYPCPTILDTVDSLGYFYADSDLRNEFYVGQEVYVKSAVSMNKCNRGIITTVNRYNVTVELINAAFKQSESYAKRTGWRESFTCSDVKDMLIMGII
ncbi:hypothetical protein AALB53_13900 [Lachnospiraceae bacterium 47-T17]